MIRWGQRINRRVYGVLSDIVVIVGLLLLLGGLCILAVGLSR